ncbi:MAG: MBL fold metallo-hydrolase [Acidimicrobiia bacterium]|nr:MBL fold metallo-hydrolase [Acidimicrobiia bacterium]MBT8198779.1 MBL fold metallo-hydrolase [Acidimicrobiia bacterium]NNF68529.1 MBL fold metallo-hydrolase [Acidimicrobiia bacterium]
MSSSRNTEASPGGGPTPSGLSRRSFLVAGAGAAGLLVGGTLGAAVAGDDGSSATEAPYEPVLRTGTPPVPDEVCADSIRVRGIETRAGAAQQQLAAIAAELLDPAKITVVTCGTGSPIPSDRAQASTAVFVGGQFLLFDAGDGAMRSIDDLDLPVVDVSAIFLTHFHSDHIADVGEVVSRSWIQGRSESDSQRPLPVYGGPGIDRVVDGFNLAYTPDEVYRTAHHGEAYFPPGTLAAGAQRIDAATAQGVVVYDQAGVVVRAYEVDHSPVAPSLGYRVEFNGSSVGISGDTIATPGFRALAAGVDVLVSDVMDKAFMLDTSCAFERIGDARNAQLFRDIRTYHIGTGELAQLSTDSGVGKLVLTHQVPTLPEAQAQQLFEPQITAAFDGDVVVANDGSRVTIDLGS